MIKRIRSGALWACLALAVVVGALAALVSPWFLLAEVVLVPLVAVGIWDLTQDRHSILRAYPIIGHLRFILEDMGPELHQYLVESNSDGRPFNRDARAVIYERSKDADAKKAFGTELDLYAEGYTWM